ncbi:MAG: hypothetical protein JO040_12990 [Gemmatimonadetes bacterium]|nr:hypothetical protein [Gemmatimonadota bacterium]
MISILKRSSRSLLVLAALTAAAACSDTGGIVDPSGAASTTKTSTPPPGGTATSYICGSLYSSSYIISPYCTGGPFGGFQSTSGTGYQSNITIQFSSPVSYVSISALDPDYSGNYMVAYDAYGNWLGQVSFQGDNSPGNFTSDTRSISASGIKSVVLVPDPLDYVAYDNLYAY